MMRFYVWLALLLPSLGMAASFDVDDYFPQPNRIIKGITVNVPVSRYYPANTY
jgi:hypothetical protein